MNGTPWTQEHTATLKRMAAVGCTDAAIGNATGHHPKTVQRHREAAGIPPYYRTAYGTWADLSPRAAASISRLIAAGCARIAA